MCLAIPGKIQEIYGEDLNKKGKVDFGGALKEISLAYVPEAQLGEYVIVHAGFAISIVDEDEAKETLEYFRQIEQLEETQGHSATNFDGDTMSQEESQ